MLQYEWYDQDPQLARDCLTALTCLSKALFPPSLPPVSPGVLHQVDIRGNLLEDKIFQPRLPPDRNLQQLHVVLQPHQ